MAKDLGIKERVITEEEVNRAIELADSDHDGVITKDEMTHWIAYFMGHCER